MKLLEKINFRQPKYMLPAILYLPILATAYFVVDLFHTETAGIQDRSLQTTEYLNPELPEAQIKGGDGIGTKYENMAKSWGRIQDHSAIDNIEREEPDNAFEEYESKYTEDDLALLDGQSQEKRRQRKLPMPGRERRKPSRNLKRRLPKPASRRSRRCR